MSRLIARLVTTSFLMTAFGATALQAQGVTEVYAETFDVSGTPSVEVDVADADLIVASNTGSTIEVRVVGRGDDAADIRELFEAMDFEATGSGGSVQIRARDANMGSDWWRSGHRAGITVSITAPAGADLDIRTADGDIEIGDFTGTAAVRSADGDIAVGRLSGERVEIHTSDGDIRVDHISDATTTVRTSDGDIDVSVSGGSIEATSGDGDVWLDIDGSTEVRIRTGDGDITVRAPQTIAAEVLLDGEDLEVDGAFRLRGRISEDRVSGDINGGGPLLEARTGDGTISLEVR